MRLFAVLKIDDSAVSEPDSPGGGAVALVNGLYLPDRNFLRNSLFLDEYREHSGDDRRHKFGVRVPAELFQRFDDRRDKRHAAHLSYTLPRTDEQCVAAAGLVAGYSFAAMRLMKPVVTVMLGVPPIGWIVLALIWFGSSGGTAIMTVVIASAPLSFAGALEGVAKRDRQLDIMAQSFGASWFHRLRTITLPHVLSYLFPAWTTTAGSAWKVTVMAELLSNSGGIGGELATARALFDIPLVTAWLAITVILALATDYGVLHVVREAAERWRSAGLPWGVKR